MQMIMLAFAVIAICTAHLKLYNGGTFKLQGGTRRQKTLTMGSDCKILSVQYIALFQIKLLSLTVYQFLYYYIKFVYF